MLFPVIFTVVIHQCMVGFGSATPVVQKEGYVCAEPNGFFSSEGECTTDYYVCVDSVPILDECPKKLTFDPMTGLCQEKCSIKIKAIGTTAGAGVTTESPGVFKCPAPNGFFAIPDICSSDFYLCYEDIPNLQTCPTGPDGNTGIFDPESLICTPREEASCFACPEPDGYFPIPGECSKDYYICLSGSPFPETCPGETVFDPETLLCANPDTASCSNPDGFRCPELNGRFPSAPDQCNNGYYLCVDGFPYPQNCPGTSVFDPYQGSCVAADNASCL